LALLVTFTGHIDIIGVIVETAGCLVGNNGGAGNQGGKTRGAAGGGVFHFLLVNTLDLPDGPNLDAAATL
jgi:hypothetical protein